jgi:hypothetical protein
MTHLSRASLPLSARHPVCGSRCCEATSIRWILIRKEATCVCVRLCKVLGLVKFSLFLFRVLKLGPYFYMDAIRKAGSRLTEVSDHLFRQSSALVYVWSSLKHNIAALARNRARLILLSLFNPALRITGAVEAQCPAERVAPFSLKRKLPQHSFVTKRYCMARHHSNKKFILSWLTLPKGRLWLMKGV